MGAIEALSNLNIPETIPLLYFHQNQTHFTMMLTLLMRKIIDTMTQLTQTQTLNLVRDDTTTKTEFNNEYILMNSHDSITIFINFIHNYLIVFCF